MASGDKIRFRQGTRTDVTSTDKEAGQLLFATYEDEVLTASGSKNLMQGDIYFDLSNGDNGVRINLANDVDKARSLYSASTLSSDGNGDWNAIIEGIDQIYDGLTIALRILKDPNEQYNTLKINEQNEIQDKKELIWFKRNEVLTTQIPAGSEVILTYRLNCGQFSVPQGSENIGSLTSGTIRNRGWVVVGVHKMNPLILGDEYTYDGSEITHVPLGTIITLKVWE